MKELSMRQRMAEYDRGREWARELHKRGQLGDLGDELVLGTFDWRDWLDRKPSSAFLNGADYERELIGC
jgi:hypothetical protein